MLLEERMVDQLLYGRSVVWVLLETLVQEIPNLSRDKEVGWDFDLVLDDFDEFFLSGDLEGIFANHHLVHHYADRPDVYLLIVLSSLEDFRADVERSPAESRAEFVVLVYRPSKIA